MRTSPCRRREARERRSDRRRTSSPAARSSRRISARDGLAPSKSTATTRPRATWTRWQRPRSSAISRLPVADARCSAPRRSPSVVVRSRPGRCIRAHCRHTGRRVAKFPSVAGDHVTDHVDLARSARIASTDDEAYPGVDVSCSLGARHERERPSPHVRFAHGRFVRTDAPAQGGRKWRRAEDNHVAPGDRFSGRDARFDVAPYPAGTVGVVADHRRAWKAGVGIGADRGTRGGDAGGGEDGRGDDFGHARAQYQRRRRASAGRLARHAHPAQ
jgi:hypothetical protein